MKRVAIATLGCRANQVDSYGLEDQLAGRADLVDFRQHADVYVINTCTVTHRGDADARNLIRRAKRRNPAAKIVVTGCYAQTNPEDVAAVEGVSVVVGNSHKDELPAIVLGGEAAAAPSGGPEIRVGELGFREAVPLLPPLTQVRGGTRGTVKIQDGCDYNCSFCIITIARGANVSLPLDDVVGQIQAYEAHGAHEVVLTGVQIGRFGRDLTPRRELADALAELLARTTIARVRLTSIDPREVTPELIDLMAREPRLCPHLHVPIQSGDDAILHLMGRNYDRAFLRELCDEFKCQVPHALLGSDVIVGFPGEGPSEFDMTLDFVETWIDHVHTFSYSDRPGTASTYLGDKVPPEVIARRSQALRDLGAQKLAAFARGLAGSRQRVLVEAGDEDGYRRGYSDHYVEVFVPAAAAAPGTLAELWLDWNGERLLGRPD